MNTSKVERMEPETMIVSFFNSFHRIQRWLTFMASGVRRGSKDRTRKKVSYENLNSFFKMCSNWFIVSGETKTYEINMHPRKLTART